MNIIDLAPGDFADLVRSKDVLMLPVAIQGYLYAVIKGDSNVEGNVYRVAIGE